MHTKVVLRRLNFLRRSHWEDVSHKSVRLWPPGFADSFLLADIVFWDEVQHQLRRRRATARHIAFGRTLTHFVEITQLPSKLLFYRRTSKKHQRPRY